jgi:hypothetical protein
MWWSRSSESPDLSLLASPESSMDITFSHLDGIFEKDGDEKLTSQLIFCGYDKDTSSFRTFFFGLIAGESQLPLVFGYSKTLR